jgi:hypothetical protein
MYAEKELPVARILVSFIVLCALVAGGVLLYQVRSTASINSFESCRDAGYPIMESYPQQCLANGRLFVE